MATTTLNFKDNWNTILTSIEAATGNEALFTVLAIAGTLLVIYAIFSTIVAKRRGTGGGGHKITVAVILGAFLAAPKLVIPAFLWVVDLLGNAVIQILRNSGAAI